MGSHFSALSEMGITLSIQLFYLQTPWLSLGLCSELCKLSILLVQYYPVSQNAILISKTF